MSNYRRLISYIYAYEGGKKGKNMGYAKIEVRGGRCKVHVNVKNVYVGSNDIGVYLLVPGQEIMLGKIFVRSGMGEFRANVAADNVENSGFGSDQCYGLTIHDVGSTWQCYTTIWDDAVSQTAEIQLADVTAEKAREKEGAPEAAAPRKSIADEIARELEAEEEKLADVAPWDEVHAAEHTETAETAETVPEAETVAKAAPEQAAVPEEQAAAEKETVPEELTAQEKTVMPEKTAAEEKEKPENTYIPEPGNPQQLEALEEQERLEQEKAARLSVWDQMASRHVKILAFDYDNGCEILSIKPQDIGLLPREIWVYGNNSFLLHGYYNYRHLILARLNNPQGQPRYLLGVPGHYFSNEKYMASMFGFPHFVLARKQPEDDGRFGYWYTDIRI